MMNKLFILILILILLFCFSKIALAEGAMDLELNGFNKAANNVDYVAKVKIAKVEVLQEADGSERHIFIADVITTYKGSTHKQISYEMFVEKGEDVMFNSTPIYLALCKSLSGSYYWPGTGSVFKPTPVIDAWVNENRDSLKLARTPAAWCD